MKFLLSALFFFTTFEASANTGASDIALPMGASLFLFPLIVFLEGYVYGKAGILKPFKKSLALNAISSTFGNLIALVTMGLPYSPIAGLLYIDTFRTGKFNNPGIAYAVILHFCLTIVIEGGFSRVFRWDLKRGPLLRAHLFSYLLITVFVTVPKIIYEFF